MPRTFKNEITLFFKGFYDTYRKGECYEQGLHVEKDLDAAFDCYRQAGQTGDSKGYLRLGQIFEQMWDQRDVLDEKQVSKPKSKNKKEQYLEQATRFYLDAALQGNSDAKRNLLRIANAGHTIAEYSFGILCEYEKDWIKAYEWHQKAANKEFPIAIYAWGRLHGGISIAANGDPVIGKNILVELQSYKKAAALYCAHALDALLKRSNIEGLAAKFLAEMYEEGQGIPRNRSKALEYYKLAGRLKDKDASFRVGQFYEGEIYNEDGSDLKDDRVNKKGPRDQNLACKYYLLAAKQGHPNATAKLREMAISDGELAYIIGEAYAEGGNALQSSQESFIYYAIAMRQCHAKSKSLLELAAKTGNVETQAEAQYALGYEFYFFIKDIPNAVRWCTRAAERNDLARRFISGTVFTRDIYLLIAQIYETGDGVSKRMSRAVDFFAKVADLGDIEMAFRVAELSMSGKNGVSVNIGAANKYYLLAVRKKHDKSLSKLREISNNNPEFAYLTGRAYETGVDIDQNTQEAIFYYQLAVKRDYSQAVRALEALANSGNPQAQYILGYEYYASQKKDIKKGVIWCIRAAEQNHPEALVYLARTVFSVDVLVLIARTYEQPPQGMEKNIPKAIEFYVRASEQGDKDSAFHVGQFYESEQNEESRGRSFYYYAIAVRNGHVQAAERLQSAANAGNVHAQYFLGYECHRVLNNTSDAIKWCMKAADQNHIEALNYLLNANFDVEIYLIIASQYERGNGVQKSILRALKFYIKASDLGDVDASLWVARHYEMGEDGIDKDIPAACRYYLISAQRNHGESLSACKRLIPELGNPDFEYELAEIYQNVYKSTKASTQWYLKAADRGHIGALARIKEMALTDPKFSYTVAQAYETGSLVTQNTQEAFIYYARSYRHDHQEAKERVTSAAETGNAQAQYALVVEYYHPLNNLSEAVKWCIRAVEQQHELALQYLMQTPFDVNTCLMIAKQYRYGDKVKKNMPRALEFYKKACELGDIDSAFQLGQLYQLGKEGLSINIDEAWRYYIQAARGGHREAWMPMLRLSEEGNAQMRQEFTTLYQSLPASNATSVAPLLGRARHVNRSVCVFHSQANADQVSQQLGTNNSSSLQTLLGQLNS